MSQKLGCRCKSPGTSHAVHKSRWKRARWSTLQRCLNMWTDNLRYQGALGKAQLGLGSGGQGTYRAVDTFILDWFTPEVRKLFLPCALYPYLCWTWGGR